MSSWIQWGSEAEAAFPAHARSQQAEWQLNASVQNVALLQLEESAFPTQIGTLDSIAGDLITLTVTEVVGNAAGYAAIPDGAVIGDVMRLQSGGFQIQIDDEIMLVRTRTVTTSPQFTYVVDRAQDGTVLASHSANAPIAVRYLLTGGNYSQPAQIWGPWTPFDAADSPDNFPDGKYPGDQSRYASDGTYLFAYPSQADYVAEQTAWVISQDGQVDEAARYRLPLDGGGGIALGSKPEDALASPDFQISSSYYPKVDTSVVVAP